VPLFDFRCRACRHEFEALVRKQVEPPCPSCGGVDLERLLSSFAVSSAEKTQAAATAKRKRQATRAHQDNIAIEREAEEHRKEDH
jgi:putative FmdB family regulatory protein